MENEFYTGEFEQLIKEKADQFRMYPSKRVWHSIYNNLHPSRRWPSVVMSLLLISSLMLIGYLHTGDNTVTRQINSTSFTEPVNEINNTQNINNNNQISGYPKTQQPVTAYAGAFDDVITYETDFTKYTVVKSNRPDNFNTSAVITDAAITTDKKTAENNSDELIQSMDTYIKSNKVFTDGAVTNKKNKPNTAKSTTGKNSNPDELIEDNTANGLNIVTANKTRPSNPAAKNNNEDDLSKLTDESKKAITQISEKSNTLTNEEKAWIENYALQNKPSQKRWKDRVAFQFYATPAVNYRKLSTKSKGSATAFANADINEVISQKPGLGVEAGAGLTYGVTKRLQLRGGLQFNYTNYNIDAGQNNHPIITTILLNDPATGYSYAAARTSTTSNSYNSSTLQPVTLHNRTYQVSVPLGFAYKLSSENNVDWFAGATVQPTYVFGGKAHLISSDLKNYVDEPSSIRTWNMSLGFETYMNFKLGTYNLQVGPQVRYQVFSTYRKDVALIEKPYAIGLKFGLTKGF